MREKRTMKAKGETQQNVMIIQEILLPAIMVSTKRLSATWTSLNAVNYEEMNCSDS
jgi:hypothetical protein